MLCRTVLQHDGPRDLQAARALDRELGQLRLLPVRAVVQRGLQVACHEQQTRYIVQQTRYIVYQTRYIVHQTLYTTSHGMQLFV